MINLEEKVKSLIIDTLALEDITPKDIVNDAPLFGEGLGLDSIDALELGIAVYKEYGIKIEASDKNVRNHFSSVSNLAWILSSLFCKFSPGLYPQGFARFSF
jgi:acyl carrier protein